MTDSMSTTREATGEPRTARGRRYVSTTLIGKGGVRREIAAIEAEARMATISAVERALLDLNAWHQEDGCRGGHDFHPALDRAEVFAAIAHLRQGEPSDDPS